MDITSNEFNTTTMNHVFYKVIFFIIRITISLLFVFFLNLPHLHAQIKKIKKNTKKAVEIEFPNSPDVTVISPKAADVEVRLPETNKVIVVFEKDRRETSSSNIILEFKSNGILSSYPPERIIAGQNTISARIELEQTYLMDRTNSVISNWITTAENLKNYTTKNEYLNYGISQEDFLPLQQEIKYQLETYIDISGFISEEQKQYYKNKMKLILPDVTARNTNQYIPPINDLIDPLYSIEFQYFNSEGLRINKNGDLYSQIEETSEYFTLPKGANKNALFYRTESAFNIPNNCYEIKYNLRLENSLSKQTIAWSKDKNFSDTIVHKIDQVSKNLDYEFMARYKKLYEAASKIREGLATTTDPKIPVELINQAEELETIIKETLNILNTLKPKEQEWILKWLWLTEGVPMINPFSFQQKKLFPEAENKLSEEETAHYQIFESMLNKGSFQVDNISHIDSALKNLPKIKAKLNAEAKAKTNEAQLYNHYLYQGLLKTTPADSNSVFMRHLNAQNDYLIMNIKPKKEINEEERMYIFAENKKINENLNIAFVTTLITDDNSGFGVDILSQIPDSKAYKNVPLANDTDEQFRVSSDSIKKFLNLVDILTAKLNTLRSLHKPPVLPFFFEYDKTPDFLTEVLKHDFLYDAPATANYSVKKVATDTTVLHQGNYRINKLYKWRFKAGVIYSRFEKRDFTETGTNRYTLDDPSFGIDGTFGIQTYFKKQDIRSKEISWEKLRAYWYVGLSMRNITENLYVGLGIEPVSGIALGINSHIGKREILTGAEGVPTAIRQTWGIDLGASVLIDAALFIKLFNFGSNSTLLGL